MTEFYGSETVKVEYGDDGNRSFFYYGRDGREDIGPEIRLAADAYNAGTVIKLREAVEGSYVDE